MIGANPGSSVITVAKLRRSRPAPDAQDDRERQLGDDQRGAHAVPRARAHRAAAGFLQRRPRVGACGEQGGHDPTSVPVTAAPRTRVTSEHASCPAPLPAREAGSPAPAQSTPCTTAQRTTSRPSKPPVKASSRLSVSGCCISRARVAPERRPHRQLLLPAHAAREHEVGDVDHAISRMRATPAVRTSSAGRMVPTTCSCGGMTVVVQPLLLSGYACSSCAADGGSARPAPVRR